jgi:light-independent protochlorophyllide reductase subunit B
VFPDAAGARLLGGALGPGGAGGLAPPHAEIPQDFDAPPEDISGQKKAPGEVIWLADAERELKKIPFFVRGKARRNTELFAAERGMQEIGIDTLYEAKAHYAR